MHGYVGPIEALTAGNRNFRRVLFTATCSWSSWP